MDKINVGILGAALNNGNLGVNALGFCLIDILMESAKRSGKNLSVTFFSTDKKEEINTYLEGKVCSFEICAPISLKKPRKLAEFIKSIKSCDLVVDITGGDSFSDIYGNNRFIRETIGKFIAEKHSKIILAPQTIGPYKTKTNTYIAKRAIEKAGDVFVRDDLSYEIVSSMTRKANIFLASDMAFLLPYDHHTIINDTRTKIGLNINALMWNGGYSKNNQFGLSVDYKCYITKLIEEIMKEPKAHIYLIPHVVHSLDVENDLLICKEIKKKYPAFCTICGPFRTPMDAKSVIKDMDIFIGGRMHSTIAAISTGTAVIPVSYSRKFEGLFNSIGYNYLINCREMNTADAIATTLEYCQNIDKLRNKAIQSKEIAVNRLNVFKTYLDDHISSL